MRREEEAALNEEKREKAKRKQKSKKKVRYSLSFYYPYTLQSKNVVFGVVHDGMDMQDSLPSCSWKAKKKGEEKKHLVRL